LATRRRSRKMDLNLGMGSLWVKGAARVQSEREKLKAILRGESRIGEALRDQRNWGDSTGKKGGAWAGGGPDNI